LFSSNGRFSFHSNKSVNKGRAASAALNPILKFSKSFSLNPVKKLLNSILYSTTLYGAGIWGMTKIEDLEKVQQRFLKRAPGLPISTRGYFTRLETGTPHVTLEIGKLAYRFWQRIMASKEDSLIRAAFDDMRRSAASPYLCSDQKI